MNAPLIRAVTAPTPGSQAPQRDWRRMLALIIALWLVSTLYRFSDETQVDAISPTVSVGAVLLHLPYALLMLFLAIGFYERIAFFWSGRAPHRAGKLPAQWPTVCVQLPMFNEHAVAARIVEAAAALQWPRGRLSIQVLDDSTDPATRELVQGICARVQARTGVPCTWLHRTDRSGYKAGALEAGRHQTEAEYIAIFDADFLPPPDFLQRAIPHFYDDEGVPDTGLALVQAQWAHLNEDESPLTEAQALWVDDHHSLQQSFRSANVGFVNFTGTAGVWRATAIEAVGGWRSASLVEDCELSMRVLFAGFRTRFVRELAAPAELPQTLAAYRSQQKRWTQGWAQLQRLHLGTLVTRYRAGWLRKLYLVYFMCISWQWPLWFSWVALLPFLIADDMWLGKFGTDVAVAIYLAPALLFALYSGVVATAQTRHGRSAFGGSFVRRCARVVSYLVVNTGMLPHHFCAFLEGLLGPMHAEFERTPKTASVTGAAATAVTASAPPPKPARPPRNAYFYVEVAFCISQLSWMVFFIGAGQWLAAIAAAWLVTCVAGIRLLPWLAETLTRRRLTAQRLEA